MDSIWLIYGLVVMGFLLLLTILGIVVYSGLFSRVQVGAGTPPIGEVRVAYKFGTGPYKNAGMLFNHTVSIVPNLRSIGVYYDDPKQVPEHKLRYAVGAILAENGSDVDQEKETSLRGHGFKIVTFPAVNNAVRTTFPFNTTISIFIAIARVYPALNRYIKDQKLCAHPVLEIYDDATIHFMMPLSRQDDFYVPETEGKKPTDESDLVDNSVNTDDSDIEKVEKIPGESPLGAPKAGEAAISKIDIKFPAAGGDVVAPPVDETGSDAGSEHSSGSSFEKIDEDDVLHEN